MSHPSPDFNSTALDSTPLHALPEVGRALPHSLEAEENVLACLMLDGLEAWPLCQRARFTSGSFYDPRHGAIFTAIADLAARQVPLDLGTVGERLQESGLLEQAGGYAFLSEVSKRVPTTAQLRFWIDQVRKQWILRQTIRRAAKITAACYAYNGEPFAEFYGPASAWFQEAMARARANDSASVETLPETVSAIVTDVELRAAGQEDRTGWIFTGFPEFDDLDSASCMMPFGNVDEDHNVLIGGGSSMGKSVLMRQLAGEAVRRGQRVLVYTLETSRRGFIRALGAAWARVNLLTLRSAPKDHVVRLVRTLREIEALAEKRLFTFETRDDPRLRTIEGIAAHARAWCAQHGTPHLIVLDYLQLIGTTKPCTSREQEVATVSHTWQALQRELGCVTIGGAQLNEAALAPLRKIQRDKEGKVMHEFPNRGALRESQALYHDADVVILLHLLTVDRTGREQVPAEVPRPEMYFVVDKRRNGLRGFAPAWFEKQYGRFEPIAGSTQRAPEGPAGPVRVPRLPGAGEKKN